MFEILKTTWKKFRRLITGQAFADWLNNFIFEYQTNRAVKELEQMLTEKLAERFTEERDRAELEWLNSLPSAGKPLGIFKQES